MDKILYISPGCSGSKGGIGLCVYNYSMYMPNFKVLVTQKYGSKLLNALFFPLVILQLIYKLLTDKEIEIVHIHGASTGSFYRKYILYKVVRLFSRIKVIYHVHGGGFKDFYHSSNDKVKKYITDIINNADMIICLSKSWQKFFADTFIPRKLNVVNNMILPPENTGKIKTDNKFTLLFLGLISDNKGIFDLLKVIANNKEQYVDKLILRIAGNGETERLDEEIKTLKIEAIVSFEGWVDAKAKEQLYRSADTLILPSYFEGVPLVILEAMSYGLPIIATNVGGIPDILKPQNNGVLIEPGDENQLNSAILKLMLDKKLQTELAECSKNGILDFYPPSVIPELQRLYKDI